MVEPAAEHSDDDQRLSPVFPINHSDRNSRGGHSWLKSSVSCGRVILSIQPMTSSAGVTLHQERNAE